MPESRPSVPKSGFANIDGRMRCPTAECWGDLLLMPTGQLDPEGFPAFQHSTTCPLCMRSFALEDDISDRDLYLRIAWLRANPDAMPGEPHGTPPG